MARATETIGVDDAQDIRDSLAGRHVCPFCGMVSEQPQAQCPRCTMENSAATRQATRQRIGPWYVLQQRNPAAPGMKFQMLLSFVQKGRVRPKSIVRGPATHQLWRFAAHVKGLSREFGICYSCGGTLERSANVCPHCNRGQDPPPDPDAFLEAPEGELTGGPIPLFRDLPAPPLVAEDLGAPQGDAPVIPARQSAGNPSHVRKGSDGFLTARDLAAAFKLNLDQKKLKVKANQPLPEVRMTARPRRRWGRRIALLLVLAAAAAVALQTYRDPVWRAKAVEYSGAAWGWIKSEYATIKQRISQKPFPKPAAQQQGSIQQLPIGVPATQPRARETDRAGSSWDDLPLANPAKAEQPVRDKPRLQGGVDEVRSLYRSAIDAEAKSDYASAVRNYEQIREFPKELWPRDLELRLKEAEARRQ